MPFEIFRCISKKRLLNRVGLRFWRSKLQEKVRIADQAFNGLYDRPLPSYLLLLFQNESSCKTFQLKMSMICMQMNGQVKHNFYKNGLSRRLVLTQSHKATRKWPISFSLFLSSRSWRRLRLKEMGNWSGGLWCAVRFGVHHALPVHSFLQKWQTNHP